MTDATTPQPDPALPHAPELVITCRGMTYTVDSVDAPIIIGRELPAQIKIDDQRMSSTHLIVDARGGRWIAADAQSTNGTFHAGQIINVVDISDGLTLHLGHPDEGIEVTFRLNATTGGEGGGVGDGVARAGAAVTVRREELGQSLRELAANAGVGLDVVVQLEKGISWPHESAHAPLEEALKWPRGTLASIRDGGVDPVEYDTSTESLSNTVRAALVVDAVQVQLGRAKQRIAALPAVGAPEFSVAAVELLTELEQLGVVAEESARASKGVLTGVVLSGVRRTYNTLMVLVATAPNATLRQRLHAARYQSELTVEEFADAAEVDVETVVAAEAGRPIDPGLTVKLAVAVEAITSLQ